MATQTQGAGDMDSEITPLEFEEDLATANSSLPDSKFDITIGHIEDIIMEGDFQQLQQNFLQKYYHEFEDTEENKFVYTDIHKQYVELVERYLQHQLADRMVDFSMPEFQKQLIDRKEELEGEVFEMLLTFSDFLSFKEMVLDFKNEREGNTVDLSGGLFVRSLSQDPSHNMASNTDPLTTPQTAPSDPTVHTLDIGGQSMMISAGGATNLDLFTVGGMGLSTQVNNSSSQNRNQGQMPNLEQQTGFLNHTNGASQAEQGDGRNVELEQVEDMNISPRPQDMDQ